MTGHLVVRPLAVATASALVQPLIVMAWANQYPAGRAPPMTGHVAGRRVLVLRQPELARLQAVGAIGVQRRVRNEAAVEQPHGGIIPVAIAGVTSAMPHAMRHD